MGREKDLQTMSLWEERRLVEVPSEEAIGLMRRYFDEKKGGKGSSHRIFYIPTTVQEVIASQQGSDIDFGADGEVSIPERSGKRVIRRYLLRIIRLVRAMMEVDGGDNAEE